MLVDRYRLDYAIGAGGMGIVWRAHDAQRQCMVAIKEVRPPESGDADPDRAARTERAVRAAGAAARLAHPGVVPVHEIVVDDGRAWIVMDLVDGRSLDERVRAEGALSPVEAAGVGLALLDVLAAAHAAGIVHGDVKPANVLMCAGGAVRLTDFALAAALGDGVPLGDPAYIAPERRRTGAGGPPADLYSLGATLAFAVTGGDPADTGRDTGDGAALDAAIRSLMAEDPPARSSAGAARAALSAAAGLDPASVPHEPPPPATALDPEPVDSRDPEPVGSPVPGPAWDPPAARRRRWSELKTAALVGTGVLAFLIAIGTLGPGNATPQAAAVPSSPATDRPASLAAEPSVPSPAASPSAQASATTRPAKTKTPAATAKPAILAAKIETDPATYRGPCTTTGLEIEVTLTITANQPGTRFTYTSTGRGTRTATTTGSTYTTTYRVRLDNSHRDTHTFTLDVTSPSPVSAQATVEDYCTRA
jgi:serine/threonine protein kinase